MTTQQLRPGSGDSRRILMITNVEWGEANVFLATSRALLEIDSDVEIHCATFAGFEDQLIQVWKDARLTNPRAKSIVYHQIKGLGTLRQNSTQIRTPDGIIEQLLLPPSFRTPLSLLTSIRAIRDAMGIFIPYTGPQIVEIISSLLDIIREVDADLVVVDSLMTAGLTACHHLGVKYTCLSPNSIKMFAGRFQPWLADLWKFPAVFSGYPFPIPFHLIPLNIFLKLCTAFYWYTDRRRRQVSDHVEAQIGVTLCTPVNLIRGNDHGIKILVSSHAQIDYPLTIPPYVYPCGPIVRSAPPLAGAAPGLADWLARGPTMYINMGSIFTFPSGQAVELARALRITFDAIDKHSKAANLQVLWKWKRSQRPDDKEAESPVFEVLGRQIGKDRVRIVDWLPVEPISILQSGHVACAVHHGGANSYNESIVAGVPQIILPQWTDCYDYSQLVELHGIGLIGSKTTNPLWVAEELSHHLTTVLQGKAARAMQTRAQQLARICEEHGNGAMNAARTLLGDLEGLKSKPR
ncbi:hypothetical protein CDD83_194 [Cordyceps sp. RAO-2017]|nr:hypothetical protein CDD83_194 [Cordyceps sp. RAO-2017]